jgi:hypothetical protein
VVRQPALCVLKRCERCCWPRRRAAGRTGDGCGPARAGFGLVDAAGTALAAAVEWTPPPKLVALYFGADWCAPCHAFVPTLRSVRDALREAGADTEVVYVSLDESEEAHCAATCTGHAVAVLDPRRAAHAGTAGAAGLAPPNLVLIDADGAVLANSAGKAGAMKACSRC